MLLKFINIKNYRSLEDVDLEIESLDDGSFTYGLIGVNEAGKSSILRSLSLKENASGLTPKEYRNKSLPIVISYKYQLTNQDITDCVAVLDGLETPIEIDPGTLSEVTIEISFTLSDQQSSQDSAIFFPCLTGECKENVETQLKSTVLYKAHKSIFWTAEPKYLISQPINLLEFANSPDTVSVPLKNCFILSGIKEIKQRIDGLKGDSTEIELLQTELGEKVTEHIKSVWSNHPTRITFLITDGCINFHVKDEDDAGGRAKTADQRSDGFKQFISFLLTISAQNKNSELSNSLLLLDEPETHLHPKAQEFLLKELIAITSNDRNNIVFFATHSNYMVDKGDLSRNYRVRQIKNKTIKEKLDKKTSSYASVTYEVFEIPNTDYHNEQYSKLHQLYQDVDPTDTQRATLQSFDDNFLAKIPGLKQDKPCRKVPNKVTLPTYVRNCIHHSDNGDKYSETELKRSIDILTEEIAKLGKTTP